MKDTTKKILIVLSFVAAAILIYLVFANFLIKGPEKVNWTELMSMYEDGLKTNGQSPAYEKVELASSTTVYLYVKENDRTAKYMANTHYDAYKDWVERLYTEYQADAAKDPADRIYKFAPQMSYVDLNSGSWVNTAITFAGFVLLAIFMVMIFRSMNGAGSKSMNFGKVKTRVNDSVKVRFADVAGAEEEKEELKEVVEFLKSPQEVLRAWAPESPRACCWSALRAPARRSLPRPLQARPDVPFFSISGS